MSSKKVVTKQILYVTDVFLDSYKANFDNTYLSLYRNKNKEELETIFDENNSDIILKSSGNFKYQPLINSNEYDAKINNIKVFYENLKHLSNIEAENEKLWVGLSNTYYLDYHIYQLNQSGNDKGLKGRAFFTQGKKRSLVLNNLSLLWWLAYYSIDEENQKNPYHLTEFLVKNATRGDLMILLSSNIISNKNVILGIIEGIKELCDSNKLRINRYAYANSNKILNQVGGIKILDVLSREEIKDIIVENLLLTDKIKLIL